MTLSNSTSSTCDNHDIASDKKQTTVSETYVDAARTTQGRPWVDGRLVRFPWVSFICLLSTIACGAGIIVILLLSHGKDTDHFCTTWQTIRGRRVKIQVTVNVWISLLMFFAGKFLAVAYGEAVTMSWWIDAMNGRSLLQLHHHWEVTRSVTSIFRRPKLFSWVCAASLCYACFSGLGIILQESSTIVAKSETVLHQRFVGTLATQLPMGWSMFGHHLSNDMADILYGYTKHESIRFDLDGCYPTSNVSCDATLLGVGFNFSCSADLHDVDTTPRFNNSVSLFQTSVNQTSPWEINMNVLFKEDEQCVASDKTASVKTRKCIMIPALVEYPVRVTTQIVTLRNAESRIAWQGDIDSVSKPIKVDTVVNILPWRGGCTNQSLAEGDCIPWEKYTDHYEETTLNGLSKTFSMTLFSNFALYWTNSTRWRSREECSEANGFCMFTQGSISAEDHDPCKRSFIDPTQTMIANIRDIMFRSSVAIATKNIKDSFKWKEDNLKDGKPNGKPSFQSIVASGKTMDAGGSYTMLHAEYQTNCLILAIGAVFMLFITLVTGSLFWNCWRLGRVVTMSPLETARALQPISEIATSVTSTNATLIDLIDSVGHVKVQYGVSEEHKLVISLHDRVCKPISGEVYK